jgi:hypothetical protein
LDAVLGDRFGGAGSDDRIVRDRRLEMRSDDGDSVLLVMMEMATPDDEGSFRRLGIPRVNRDPVLFAAKRGFFEISDFHLVDGAP